MWTASVWLFWAYLGYLGDTATSVEGSLARLWRRYLYDRNQHEGGQDGGEPAIVAVSCRCRGVHGGGHLCDPGLEPMIWLGAPARHEARAMREE